MITSRYKPAFNAAFDPLARLLVALKVSPSAVTLAGLALVFACCAFLLRTRQIIPFSFMVTAASLFDALDGAVARRGVRTSAFGSYLDAMCDRYGEVAVLLSVAVVTGYWIGTGLLLSGSLLVSYAKARAAMETSVSNQEWPDFMERMERDVIYIVGLWQSQIIPWRPFGRDVFWWTLTILAVLVHVTVVQRIFRARRFILQRAR